MSQPAITAAASEAAATVIPEAAVVTEGKLRGPLAVLRQPQFARYAAGDSISNVGYWMQAAAQSLVITSLSTRAVDLGWVNFCSSFPMLALTMYGGTVADRFDKRKIIIASQVVQVILAAAIGWLVGNGQIAIWHLYVAAVVLGISAAFEMPATSALVPEMVTREEIAAAVAIDRSIFHGSRMVGFAAAGWVIGKFGKAAGFYVNAISFLASIPAVALVSPRPKGDAKEEEERQSGMKAGIDYVRKDKPTLAMLGLMASGAFFVFPFIAVMLPQFARHTMGFDERLTSYLWSFSGIGALVASFAVPAIPRPKRMFALTLGVADVAISLAALGLAKNFTQAAIALTALGVGTAFNFGVANTSVQERAPSPMRGRVSALAMMSFVGIMPFTSLGITELADSIGFRTAMVGGAICYATFAFWLLAGAGRKAGEPPVEQ